MKIRDMDLYDILEYIRNTGNDWANAKQILDHKERFSKVVLSRLIVDYKSSRGKITQTELERLAYSDPEYITYLDEWAKAEKDELQLRIKLEAYRNLFVACQDKNATMRREKPIL